MADGDATRNETFDAICSTSNILQSKAGSEPRPDDAEGKSDELLADPETKETSHNDTGTQRNQVEVVTQNPGLCKENDEKVTSFEENTN